MAQNTLLGVVMYVNNIFLKQQFQDVSRIFLKAHDIKGNKTWVFMFFKIYNNIIVLIRNNKHGTKRPIGGSYACSQHFSKNNSFRMSLEFF